MSEGSVTDSEWSAEVIESEIPVLIEFWAEWQRERRVQSIVAQFGTEQAGRVKVLRLNVDENPKTAQAYGITSVPTLLVIEGGEEVERIVGLTRKSRIEAAVPGARVQPHASDATASASIAPNASMEPSVFADRVMRMLGAALMVIAGASVVPGYRYLRGTGLRNAPDWVPAALGLLGALLFFALLFFVAGWSLRKGWRAADRS